ncbi:hypothetical protein HUG17_0131 [Dermatophagoides farinae]|uniref:Uncharacterized protein n=1 Tax=Dermatophagoides farinae TaxID=6954 RepID=A0A9D4P620_DERFA|nr:hypothetical protein HUG17_0131 [Dermatophagoides farinae]
MMKKTTTTILPTTTTTSTTAKTNNIPRSISELNTRGTIVTRSIADNGNQNQNINNAVDGSNNNIVIPLPAHRLNDRSLATGVIVISQDHGFPPLFHTPIDATSFHHHPHAHYHPVQGISSSSLSSLPRSQPVRRYQPTTTSATTSDINQLSTDIGRHYHYELLSNNNNLNDYQNQLENPFGDSHVTPRSTTTSTTTTTTTTTTPPTTVVNHFNLPATTTTKANDQNDMKNNVNQNNNTDHHDSLNNNMERSTIIDGSSSSISSNNKFNPPKRAIQNHHHHQSSMKARIQVTRPKPNVVNIDLIKTLTTTTMTNPDDHEDGVDDDELTTTTATTTTTNPHNLSNEELTITTTAATPTMIDNLDKQNDSIPLIITLKNHHLETFEIPKSTTKTKKQRIGSVATRIQSLSSDKNNLDDDQPRNFDIKLKSKTLEFSDNGKHNDNDDDDHRNNHMESFTLKRKVKQQPHLTFSTQSPIAILMDHEEAVNHDEHPGVSNDENNQSKRSFTGSTNVLNSLVKELNQAIENRMRELANRTESKTTTTTSTTTTTTQPSISTTTTEMPEITTTTTSSFISNSDENESTEMEDDDDNENERSTTTTTTPNTVSTVIYDEPETGLESLSPSTTTTMAPNIEEIVDLTTTIPTKDLDDCIDDDDHHDDDDKNSGLEREGPVVKIDRNKPNEETLKRHIIHDDEDIEDLLTTITPRTFFHHQHNRNDDNDDNNNSSSGETPTTTATTTTTFDESFTTTATLPTNVFGKRKQTTTTTAKPKIEREIDEHEIEQTATSALDLDEDDEENVVIPTTTTTTKDN